MSQSNSAWYLVSSCVENQTLGTDLVGYMRVVGEYIGIGQEAINLLLQRLDSGRVSRARSGPVNVFPYCLLPSNSLTQIVRTIDRCLAAARSGV